MAESFRPAWAEVDLDAVAHNVELLVSHVAPAGVCAVVKAGAYGHGAVPVARAAVDAGATWLAVALVEEGLELRRAGIDAPVLVLSEAPPGAAAALVAGDLTPTVAGRRALGELVAAARAARRRLPVHVKVDTGMHRVGVPAAEAVALLTAVAAETAVALAGIYTHLAVADGTGEADRAFTRRQLDRFDDVVGACGVDADASLADGRPLLHAANSAGALAWPEARYDLVRCGIACYGVAPSEEIAAACPAVRGLRPALRLHARVSAVRQLEPGDRPSYGRRRPLPDACVVATVPLGYADGVSRALFAAGAEVLIGGRRLPIAGTITMDQLMVDCGPEATVAPGDEVVLLGSQGDEAVTADEWAARTGTIAYEVLCGIGPRVPRRYVNAAG